MRQQFPFPYATPSMTDLLDTVLEELSPAARNALRRGGLFCVKDLVQKPLPFARIGDKSREEIEAAFAHRGLQLYKPDTRLAEQCRTERARNILAQMEIFTPESLANFSGILEKAPREEGCGIKTFHELLRVRFQCRVALEPIADLPDVKS